MTEKEKYEEWLSREDLDAEVRAQLEAMRGKDTEIFESFYRDLEFGTAGLRGILGAGTNRMNIYTVGKATMGFARYLKENFKAPSVAIAYDCRKIPDCLPGSAQGLWLPMEFGCISILN